MIGRCCSIIFLFQQAGTFFREQVENVILLFTPRVCACSKDWFPAKFGKMLDRTCRIPLVHHSSAISTETGRTFMCSAHSECNNITLQLIPMVMLLVGARTVPILPSSLCLLYLRMGHEFPTTERHEYSDTNRIDTGWFHVEAFVFCWCRIRVATVPSAVRGVSDGDVFLLLLVLLVLVCLILLPPPPPPPCCVQVPTSFHGLLSVLYVTFVVTPVNLKSTKINRNSDALNNGANGQQRKTTTVTISPSTATVSRCSCIFGLLRVFTTTTFFVISSFYFINNDARSYQVVVPGTMYTSVRYSTVVMVN